MSMPSAANDEIWLQEVLAPSTKDESDPAIFNTRNRKKPIGQARLETTHLVQSGFATLAARRRSQAVRQGPAKPSFSGSNPRVTATARAGFPQPAGYKLSTKRRKLASKGFLPRGMPSTDSTELMQRVARDDEGALGELIAAFAPQLLRFAWRMLPGNPEEAEDVVQDTFVRVWSARRRWQPTACVSTYLYTIATRLCLNRRRSWLRRPPASPLPEADEASHPGDGAPNPERVAASAQLRRALATELAALPPNQRAAILLRHEGGLAYAEIAAALDTSAGAVESLLSRARARLRQRLADWMSEGNPAGRG
jgi:RNA polymerase sigma-70 factor (ECF subfamily)